MTKDEALRLALEALKTIDEAMPFPVAKLAIKECKAALEANEFNPDWDTQSVLVEEIQRMAKRIEELEAKDEPWEKFCDSNCVWTDHHPDCKLAKDEPVSQPKVRTGNCLRVGVCASEGHKIQPQRTWVGLTDEEIEQGCKESWVTLQAWQSAVWWAEAKLKEKNT